MEGRGGGGEEGGEGYLVCGLRTERNEVPEHIGVLKVCLGVPLLSVNE